MVEHERDSRLMLGTVQFGMPYGMANRTGQPAYRDARAIVEAAIEGGINGFDTAASYGTSEQVLGQVLYELGVSDRVVVVTKVRPLEPSELSDPSAAARAVEQSVARSRRRLRLDCLPVVLFHRESDAIHLPVLRKLSERGWLKHYGVSCENRPGPAAKFVAAGSVSALQLPGNLLDPRHLRSGILEAAADREIRIFVRSIYLQGLLALPEDDIPPALSDIVPILRSLAAIARDAGVSLVELALRYVLSLSGVSSVLVGVETVSQIQDNLVMSDRGPLDTDLLTAIDASIPELPETLITPKLWPRPG